MAKGNKGNATLCLLSSILVLAAAGFSFLGLASATGNSGPIVIPTITLIGGGELSVVEAGGSSSLSFSINIPILVTAQVFLLSFLSCLLSVGSRKTGVIAAIFLFISFALAALSLSFVSWVNPAIPASSIKPALGYFLLIGCIGAAFLLELLAVVFIKNKK